MPSWRASCRSSCWWRSSWRCSARQRKMPAWQQHCRAAPPSPRQRRRRRRPAAGPLLPPAQLPARRALRAQVAASLPRCSQGSARRGRQGRWPPLCRGARLQAPALPAPTARPWALQQQSQHPRQHPRQRWPLLPQPRSQPLGRWQHLRSPPPALQPPPCRRRQPLLWPRLLRPLLPLWSRTRAWHARSASLCTSGSLAATTATAKVGGSPGCL